MDIANNNFIACRELPILAFKSYVQVGSSLYVVKIYD